MEWRRLHPIEKYKDDLHLILELPILETWTLTDNPNFRQARVEPRQALLDHQGRHFLHVHGGCRIEGRIIRHVQTERQGDRRACMDHQQVSMQFEPHFVCKIQAEKILWPFANVFVDRPHDKIYSMSD